MTWNADDPKSIPEKLVNEAIKKGHTHTTSFGGMHIIVHYDEERKEIDIYKLHEYVSLEGWKGENNMTGGNAVPYYRVEMHTVEGGK